MSKKSHHISPTTMLYRHHLGCLGPGGRSANQAGSEGFLVAFELGFFEVVAFFCLSWAAWSEGFCLFGGGACFIIYIQVMDPTNRQKEVIVRQICTHDFLGTMTRFLGPDTGMALKLKYLIQVLPLVHLLFYVHSVIRNMLGAQVCSRGRVYLLLLPHLVLGQTTGQQQHVDGHRLATHRDPTACAEAHVTAKYYCYCNQRQMK